MAGFIGTVASAALLVLATTGDPVPLQKEVGGEIVESSVVPAESVLAEGEHLAPSALKMEDGSIVAMVAPTITKDNFVVFENGVVKRLDVGHTEGTNIPFMVDDVDSVKDGGANVVEQLGHWFQGMYSKLFG